MHRDLRLRGLSSDHHQALVLARMVARLVEAGAWTLEEGERLATRFEEELEPHFAVEEAVLLPALHALEQRALIERTEADHALLRTAALAASHGDLGAARAFADCLIDHVRFEERELFPACERLLDEATLERVLERARETNKARKPARDGA